MKLKRIFENSSYILDALSYVARYWFVIVLAAIYFSPVTPHMRWSYQYVDRGYERHYIRCHYLGVNGMITPDIAPHCPLFALLDVRDWTN